MNVFFNHEPKGETLYFIVVKELIKKGIEIVKFAIDDARKQLKWIKGEFSKQQIYFQIMKQERHSEYFLFIMKPREKRFYCILVIFFTIVF